MRDHENYTLSTKYIVDDLPGARQIGSRLYGILSNIDTGSPVSQLARDFLTKSGLLCLHALVEGQVDLATFNRDALIERKDRIEKAEIAARKAATDAEKLKTERAAASAEIFNDPEYKRRREAKQLRREFGLGFVEPEHYPRIMRLLKLLKDRKRLPPKEVIWFQTEADYCWTKAVSSTWHSIEAEALTDSWRVTGDPWEAINACSHWRKCDQSQVALQLSDDALAKAKSPSAKVQSALATTRGGALRDLQRYAEALASGEVAARGLTVALRALDHPQIGITFGHVRVAPT